MLDGIYDIESDTPLGVQRGTAVISTSEGGRASASIDMGSLGRDTLTGTHDGDTFRTSGERRQFPFGKVAYTISGSVTGDSLNAHLSSRVADFDITGTRR